MSQIVSAAGAFTRTCIAFPGQVWASSYFNRHFAIVKADTDALRTISHRMRYQIFCVERGFPMQHSNGQEYDAHDGHSLAFLIQHRPSGTYIGTGRIILPHAPGDNALPAQARLRQEVQRAYGLQGGGILPVTCEISRLGVPREFARASCPLYGAAGGGRPALMRRHLPGLAKLGLYRGVFDLALNHAGMEHCVFITDSFLLSRFDAIGFREYSVMDDQVQCFGVTSAVYFNIGHMLLRARREVPLHWSVVTDNGNLLRRPSAAGERHAA